MFKKRENIYDIEEGNLLSPKFDNDGLIPVITMCSKTKDILMHGYMNVEALKKTIETKEAHYFSRSRKTIWHKGKTSGFYQKVTEIKIDDDQDSRKINYANCEYTDGVFRRKRSSGYNRLNSSMYDYERYKKRKSNYNYKLFFR